MNNFWQRLTTGSLFVGLLLAGILYSMITFQLLFLITSQLCLAEFYKITKNENCTPQLVPGLLVGSIVYSLISAVACHELDQRYELLFLPVFLLLFIIELFRSKTNPFNNVAYTILGIIYTVLPFAYLSKIAMHGVGYDSGIIVGFFILLWSSDTFAYIFGNLLGKHALFKRHSPKKSWEGSVGGAVSSIVAGFILWKYNPQLTLTNWIVIALIIVVTGTLGDLTESMLKRSLNVKDSGALLPGHGGVLDRFDGLLFAVPFVWCYLVIIN